GAGRHHIPKVQARALTLRGEALIALERGEDADLALAEAVRIADAIGYPRGAWRALGTRVILARRLGRSADVALHATAQRALIAACASSSPIIPMCAAPCGRIPTRCCGGPTASSARHANVARSATTTWRASTVSCAIIPRSSTTCTTTPRW